MKKLLILFLLFFITTLHSQSDSTEKGFSVGFGIGFLFPQVDDGPGGIRSGLIIKPLLQLSTSKNFALFTEFNYCRLGNQTRFFGESARIDYMLINIGSKVYPRNKERIYIKTGLGIAYSSSNNRHFGYSLNGGIGSDFKIDKRLNFFTEGEISLHKLDPYSNWYSIYDLIIVLGLKYKL